MAEAWAEEDRHLVSCREAKGVSGCRRRLARPARVRSRMGTGFSRGWRDCKDPSTANFDRPQDSNPGDEFARADFERIACISGEHPGENERAASGKERRWSGRPNGEEAKEKR